MTIRQKCLREEMEFPKWFSNYEEKEYGIIFYNEKEKESHDSNHAVLYHDKINSLHSVLTEIKDFYLNKGITPRIYQPYKNNYFADNKATFEKCGYTIQMYENSRFMLLSKKNTIAQGGKISIKRLVEWDERIATDMYFPADESYGIEVEKNSLKNRNYFLYCGFLGDEIVTLISFHLSEYDCTRFDYILTAPKHRGKGYAKDLIGYVSDYCTKNNFPNCFQWPTSEISEKTSSAAGFEFAFEEQAGAAIYDIKSVMNQTK